MKPDKRIFLSPPHMAGREFEYLKEAFDSNWIAPVGPDLTSFEDALCKYTGAKQAAVLGSGTAALHLSLILLEIERGDEVLVSSFTFAASANPVTYLGAVPIFIDSEPGTWNMDPALLEEAIEDRIKLGRKPKAVVAVDLYGMPFRVAEIGEICARYEIPLIEDAAEALGSSWKGQRCGTLGKLGILSFNGNKIITTSGGGALVGNDQALISKARYLATQARDPAPYYEHTSIGYNYRLSNLLAAVGRGQLEQLDGNIERRREIFGYYRERLSRISGTEFLLEPDSEYFCNRWLTTVVFDHNEVGVGWRELVAALEEKNIESRPLWKPMHLQPVYQECPSYLNGTSERLFDSGICLPSGSGLTEIQLDLICSTIEERIRN